MNSTYEEHIYDKRICDEEPPSLSKGIRLWQDTGFVGHNPKGIQIYMPKKSLKGKILLLMKNRRIRKFLELG